MRTIFLLLIFLVGFQTHSQTFTQSQVKADAAYLIEQIKTYNKGLLQFNPDFDAQTEKLINKVPEEMPILEYFALMAQISALSNEGHMGIGDWSDTVHNGFKTRYSYMPLSVKVIGNQLFVWKDYSNENKLFQGDEVLAINGRSIASILDKIRKCLPSDGHITTYLDHQISYGFPWMYYLYVEQTPNFQVIYQNHSDGAENSVMIKALEQKEMRVNYGKIYGKETVTIPDSTNGVYHIYHNDKNSYTYITLKSFNRQRLEKNKIKAKTFYKDLFKDLQLKGTKNLVFDLRDNNGGRKEMAFEILPYLLKSKKDGPYVTSISYKGKVKEYKHPKPSKYAFQGDIYVLVNGSTFSAASSLARYLKEYGNATIIGEEGGGRYEGFVAGSRQYVNLPNSNIQVSIPRYVNNYPKSEKQTESNRGILPDIPVQMSILDYIDQKDPFKEKVLEIISQQD